MMENGTRVKVDPVAAWSGAGFRCRLQRFVLPRVGASPDLEAEIRFFVDAMYGEPGCDVEIKMAAGRLTMSPDDARQLASLLRKAAEQADAVTDEAAREMGLDEDDEGGRDWLEEYYADQQREAQEWFERRRARQARRRRWLRLGRERPSDKASQEDQP